MSEECIHEMPFNSCAFCNGKCKDRAKSNLERRRSDSEGLTKHERCNVVADLFGVPRVKMSNGGSEPTFFWDSILKVLEIPIKGSKPEKARTIARSQGVEWPFAADSTDTSSEGGGTVTTAGWIAVHKAANRWSSDSTN